MFSGVSNVYKYNDTNGHYSHWIPILGHFCWRQKKCDQEGVREDTSVACNGLSYWGYESLSISYSLSFFNISY